MTRLYPHRIRLRGPWECATLRRADGGPLPEPGRLTMPGQLAFAGHFRMQRRFQWPAGLDPLERHWLTFAGATGAVSVSLNDSPLGRHDNEEPFDFDVTGLLQPRNLLTVELHTDQPEGGLWGEVALEVRRSAYLRQVEAICAGSAVRVTGQVAGSAGRPLELYVLFDDSTVSYSNIVPEAVFDLMIPVQLPPRQVRVELIDGGVVWYQSVIDLALPT